VIVIAELFNFLCDIKVTVSDTNSIKNRQNMSVLQIDIVNL